ncbi:hypothetical protein DL770_007684 [Monosporascus sp. CRB-9-2]|nr:hypothetical protein DL770_007684 [Monosporascus sp. CRB-9-2]
MGFEHQKVRTLTLAAHARYGRVVRVAPHVYTPGVLGETAPLFQTLPGRKHARKRKRVASSFALSNLAKLEGQVDECVIEWTTIVGRRFADTGARMGFAAWSHYSLKMVCYDAVSELTFGEPLGSVREARDLSVHATVRGSSGAGKIMADGSPIILEEAKVECFVLMVAGSDTTAALFCGFVRYVLEIPGVLDHILTEIDDLGRRGLLERPVSKFEGIVKLPYFMACYREALQFDPPVPIILPRYVSLGGVWLLNVDDKFTLAGTGIGAKTYVSDRGKGVFGDDADDFRPERWLEDAEKEANMDIHLLSWGYGARICLRRHIAQPETYKVLIQVRGPLSEQNRIFSYLQYTTPIHDSPDYHGDQH